MLNRRLSYFFVTLLSLASLHLAGREILFEIRDAYFLGTGHNFRKIYHKGGNLFEPELTFQLRNDSHWYGFASVGYLGKKGHSIGLCDSTKVHLVPLALGLKYFVPFHYGDVYVGLGFQPVYTRTTNCSPYVAGTTSNWGFGGITKMGLNFDLPHNLFIDLFFDFSFVKVGCKKECSGVTPIKANISGAIFGGGLGYRFW